MRHAAQLILVCGLLLAFSAELRAGCRPRPHGPYGGPCYACGGPGLARGYPRGYYSFGSWGYAPRYALGNYGYGSGFGTNPAYSTEPDFVDGYCGPGYQSGYPGRRGYCLIAYYFGSGGYVCRRPMPRDYGGEYGGIWSPPVQMVDYQEQPGER